MRILRLIILITTLCLVALPISAASIPDAPQPRAASATDARKELAAYFSNLERNSPTVLGGLASSPEAIEAIQARIASMSDAEVARFQKLMNEAPDWKAAPEAIAGAFPPDVLEQIQRVGEDYAARAPKGDRMRERARTLITVLEQMPDAKLAELGIDRKLVSSLEETFRRMSPLEATMLQARAGQKAPLDEKSAAAMNALPVQLQRGAAALADHGPLTEGDFEELERFRTELIALFARIEKLPPDARRMLDADALQKKVAQLTVAPPDVLFMMRVHIPDEMLSTLESSIALLERVAGLSEGERKDLERFRDEFTGTFTGIDGDQESSKKTRELMGQLGPAELYMLQQRMEPLGAWQVWLPAFYEGLAAPELRARVASVRGASADPEAIARAERFRDEALAYIDAAAARPGVDEALAGRARKAVAEASVERLEVLRTVVEKMPQAASTDDMLAVAAMVDFNCWLDLPSPAPDISLDFICNPIESALNTVESAITATANSILAAAQAAINAAISTMQSAIQSSIAAVNSVIDTVVSAITSTVDSIWTFIQTIPDLAWEAIQAALDLLLDIEIANGVTVRDLVASGAQTALTSMKTLAGLSGTWWTAVSTFTLPQIPCPATGFHTPFGDVGDGAAADNYGRYRLLIDGIIGLIPDTETSLAIKIPAQVLYMAFDFLGICLEQAAADADAAEASQRHSLVLTNFTNLQSFVGTQIAGLASQAGDQSSFLLTAVTTQSTVIQNLINNQSGATRSQFSTRSNAIQALIQAESSDIRAMIGSESSDIQDQVETFRTLNLRLIIERVLQGGVGAEVALLQLPGPAGYLGLVREIVQMSLDGLAATQQGSGQARKLYDKGTELAAAGNYKDAFKQFAMAYREAAK